MAANAKKLLMTSLERLRRALKRRSGGLVASFARALIDAVRGLGVMAKAVIAGEMGALRALESSALREARSWVNPAIGVHANVERAVGVAPDDMQAGGRQDGDLKDSEEKLPPHSRVVQAPLGPERTRQEPSPVQSRSAQSAASEEQTTWDGQPNPEKETTGLEPEPMKPVPRKP